MPASLSVVVASGGRSSLAQTLAALIPQLTVYDEFIVVGSQVAPWGHASRNRAMSICQGDYVAFCDDDDCWEPDAVQRIWRAIEQVPGAVHVFAWRTVVVPNRQGLPLWDGDSDGLRRFVEQAARRLPLVVHGDRLLQDD